MIQVTNLFKQYGELIAVEHISCKIYDGELFGLLGPNGAGKTTTINMMVGALLPDEGSVTINNQGSPTEPEVRMKIGNAPQSLALYDDLTAEENLIFFGRLYNLRGKELEKRVMYALELAGLVERKKDRVSTFSGGMKRRINFACAVVHNPEVLFLDEPTVGVDPQSRNLIFGRIEELKNQERTIVYTTHYMEEAQRLCDRVAIIDQGKILALDTVENLITQYGGKSVIEAELETLPDESINLPGRLVGMHLRVETDTPLEDAMHLVESGIRFRTLRIDRADLETVFLNLTGRRLRD